MHERFGAIRRHLIDTLSEQIGGRGGHACGLLGRKAGRGQIPLGRIDVASDSRVGQEKGESSKGKGDEDLGAPDERVLGVESEHIVRSRCG